MVAWGARVSPDFLKKVVKICRDLGWSDDHVSWLMSCMAFETGESFSPSVKNGAGSGATGLIQFMPPTARGLGTTTEAMAQMSGVDQLDYVKAYFKPYARRISSLTDMYMAILLPKYVGMPDDSVLFTDGTVAYRQNSGFDKNKDGVITKREAAALVAAKHSKGQAEGYASELPSV